MSENIQRPYIIVVGNEKGGVGKTTIAVHVITSLLYDGYLVSSMDLDSRQRSLSNYLENRAKYLADHNIDLPMPAHLVVNKSRLDSVKEGQQDEEKRFTDALKHACGSTDIVVIDAPGNDTHLSRFAHSFADTIITPINDSFVDLNLLVQTNDETFAMNRHGLYSEVVWQAKMQKASRSNSELDWVVSRNRLSHIDARNKRNMLTALENFSKRSGARVAEGLSERVIYKELFLKGMTLLDIVNEKTNIEMTMSHVAARRELRTFMDFLNLKDKLAKRQKVSKEKGAEPNVEKKVEEIVAG